MIKLLSSKRYKRFFSAESSSFSYMSETVDFTSVYMPLLNREMLSSIFEFEQKNFICQLHIAPVFTFFLKKPHF